MSHSDQFFMRDPWVYDPQTPKAAPRDTHLGFDTRALHTGFDPAETVAPFRSFVPPIVQSMTFPYENFAEIPCPVYGRTRTPTNTVLEERLAALEGGEACVTAGSGSQALFNLIFTIARPGDNVVTSLNIFGEGYKQAATIFPERCNIDFRFVEAPADPAAWGELMDERTKVVWIETPSNPTLFVTDIAAVAEVAHAKGVPLMVDNTTATAALQQPMALGADIVLLSLTKFLAGNATVIGGAIVGPEPLVEDIRWNTTEFLGSVVPPQDAFLMLQYLETLGMRMLRHSSNSQSVAAYLAAHPKVGRVNYTGLEDHPQHALASRQMCAHGGLISFVAPGGMAGAAKLINGFRLICHAVTFGTSRSICMHPATITHEHMTPEERAAVGIDDGLIRLSVGLEDPADIMADLEQALQAI
ncbi:MAG: aminotransferase class I/II-fold pyridoxal phosphate-dependent enzyme [Desulfosarcinaceae bacterium]|nr:aminotransferase class I/II-fold pyridoxal phosphate-dependent enzyme [Desulfosarcinaceae bacterium]